jgi:hypothetical protein
MFSVGDILVGNKSHTMFQYIGKKCTFVKLHPTYPDCFLGVVEGETEERSLTLGRWDLFSSAKEFDPPDQVSSGEHIAGLSPEKVDWDKVMRGGWCGD